MVLRIWPSLIGLALSVAADSNWTQATWDVIVVGAGPAGLIVADRMSEANKTTLLLEDGGPSYYVTGGRERPSWLNGTDLSRVDVPGLYKSIFDDGGKLVCGNLTTAYGGCTIGGSSAINAGLFFQPPDSDFDLYFPSGWKSRDMQNAIKKLYARQPSANVTSDNKMLYLQSGYDVAREWLVDNANYTSLDINQYASNKTKVFGHPIFDYSNGQRGGPATTYLQSAKERSNFRLQSGARVSRVVREGDNATGVMVQLNGTGSEIFVRLSQSGRVVLSGGAIQSPQLLMSSGIGDSGTLMRLATAGKLQPNLTSAEWINNTAIGQGLFDNPNTFIEFQSANVSSYVYSYNSPIPADASLYLRNRSGPYSFASETSVFWTMMNNSAGRQVGLQGTIDSAGYNNLNKNGTITLNVYGTSGLGSRGNVTLNDDFVPGPSDGIYYSDLQDARDIATFIRSIFDSLPTSLMPLNIARNASVDEIYTYITTPSAYAVGQVNHWSSSCKIGTCVDGNTTVIGTRNIHVVDGSIVEPLTVNPQFGIMAAAERASELILALLAT